MLLTPASRLATVGSMPTAISELRHHALRAFEAAVDAVQPDNLLPQALEEISLDVPPGGRLIVAALGKAAPGLAASWRTHRPLVEDHLVVLTPHRTPIPPGLSDDVEILFGAHPLPDRAGKHAAGRLYQLATGLGPDDRLLVLLSGGASALLALPAPDLTLEELNLATNAMLQAGASISELNTVRRELLVLGGGGLLLAAWPAIVTTLVLSDVPGDPLHDIASGPTVASPTGTNEALAVLDRFELLEQIPSTVQRVLVRGRSLQTNDAHRFAPSRTVLMGSNRTAVDAAASYLKIQRLRPRTESDPLIGEASERGRQLARLGRSLDPTGPGAVVFGGETTVTVRGEGVGGRNSELCLAAALELEGAGPCVVLSAGTDGIDGISGAAGGIVDPQTTNRIRSAGMNPTALLKVNDSATALSASGDTVITGPTGTNVSDVMLVIAGG